MREEPASRESEIKDKYIFGIHPVIEALESGAEIERVFIQRDLNNDGIKKIKQLLRNLEIHAVSVPVDKLNRITRKNHQGVICYLSLVSYCRVHDIVPVMFEKGVNPVVVMLDRVTDVRNFGAICRTAECAGAGGVIIPERGGAAVNGDAVKASAGALHRIPVCREHNLKETIDYLKDSGFQIVGCTEKGASELYSHSFDGPVCIIMGSEENGISDEYLKRCDAMVKIPMEGSISSYNVSVASGIVLYEVMRQKLNSDD